MGLPMSRCYIYIHIYNIYTSTLHYIQAFFVTKTGHFESLSALLFCEGAASAPRPPVFAPELTTVSLECGHAPGKERGGGKVGKEANYVTLTQDV